MSNINQKLAGILNPDTGGGIGRKQEQVGLYGFLANEGLCDESTLSASVLGPRGL
jgi:hypothetical protein